MTNKNRSNRLVILVVFTLGLAISVLLQLSLLEAKAKEERYEFESQVSNLTLFVTDSLNEIVNQFNLLVKMAAVSDAFNNDNYLARFSQLSFQENSSPITFTIFGKNKKNAKYKLRHISGKYAALANKKIIAEEVENALLSVINGDLKKLNSSRTNSFFLELKSTGKISCLSREIFEKGNKRKILMSCFKLNDILNGVLERSSYHWLEALLYLGDKKNGHKLVYNYTMKGNSLIIDPLSMQGDSYIFLPWVLRFANNNLSVLFSFDGYIRETNHFRYIPSIFGLLLTLSICGYLISLNRRNSQISLKVEEKTKAYHELNSDLEKEIKKKENVFEQLRNSAEELRALTNSVNGVIWEADPNTMKYLYISDQVEKILGFKSEDYMSGKLQLGGEEINGDATPISTLMQNNFDGPDSFTIEYQGYRADKKLIWIRNIISKRFQDEVLVKVRGVFFDITEEKKLEEQRGLMEGKLKHAQKMESIGRLAAGIAHEINTPSQFVGDNLVFIDDSTKDFMSYQKQLESLIHDASITELTEQLTKAKQQFDIEFLELEIPQAIEQSIDGVSRIAEIVSAMKDFSHPGKEDKQKIDINRAIESTTIVARNEWKFLADLAFDFTDNISMVNCFPGEINQVILNMIVNACHAIEEITHGTKKGNILISTIEQNGTVIIKITDDGAGMEAKIVEHIFDPFFTTKDVGQGTGQGLSLAYSVIVEKHGGHISVESLPGHGATFIIQLPI